MKLKRPNRETLQKIKGIVIEAYDKISKGNPLFTVDDLRLKRMFFADDHAAKMILTEDDYALIGKNEILLLIGIQRFILVDGRKRFVNFVQDELSEDFVAEMYKNSFIITTVKTNTGWSRGTQTIACKYNIHTREVEPLKTDLPTEAAKSHYFEHLDANSGERISHANAKGVELVTISKALLQNLIHS